MLRIWTQGNHVPKLLDWKFCTRNINKIAYNYDAKVEKIDKEVSYARLKDSYGRLLLIDEASKRQCSKCGHLI